MKQQTETSRLDHGKQIFGPTILVLLVLAALWPLKTYVLTPAADRIAPQAAQADHAGLRRSAPSHVAPAHSRIPASGSQTGEMQLIRSYGKLPLSFEANHGQADSQVKFLSRGGGYTLFLTSTEAVLALRKPKATVVPTQDVSGAALAFTRASILESRRGRDLFFRSSPFSGFFDRSKGELLTRDPSPESQFQSSLRMKFVGAKPTPRLTPLEQLPGKANYFIGKDSKKWRTNVRNYAKVKYHDIYRGVDLIYYGNQGQLEYDFVVAPGADPRAIKLGIHGSTKVKVDGRGDLVVDVGSEEIRFHKPVAYQAQPVADAQQLKAQNTGQPQDLHPSVVGSGPRMASKHFLDANYALNGNNEVTFDITAYDKTKPLVIDPVLSYSTYLGGSGDDLISPFGVQGITVDPEGNAYVIGVTDSTDFPVTPGALQTKFAGGGSGSLCGVAGDAFVTKLSAKGDAIVYSTYLGGSSDDCGEGIAVDPAGNVFIAGETLSTDFPITNGAFQLACASCSNGAPDTFAAKLSRDGSSLIYSTYIGGSDADLFPMIAIDRSGNMYIEGTTFSKNYPTTAGAFQLACASCANGAPDTYVTKLNADGTALVYSTYLGGSDFEICGAQIAVDSEGSAYVNGLTCSNDFPTHNPLQATLAGGCNGLLTKLNPAGSALVYSTYLGGSNFDTILGTAIDSAGNAYISGLTYSSDFPTTPGAFQTNFVGGSNCPSPPCSDAFVAKMNPNGSGLVYSSYLVGNGDDAALGVAVDSDGNAYLGGSTSSTDFPTLNAFQPANAGGYDGFVTELNAAGNALVYSTYLGGNSDDFIHTGFFYTSGIAIDSRRNVYLEGNTTSSDFLVVNPMQPQFGGGTFDAVLAKISPIDAPGLGLSRLSVDFGAQASGTTSATQVVTVRNVGSQTLVVQEIHTEPEFAQTNTCTSPLAPYESCTISVTFTPTGEGQAEGELIVVANSRPASRKVSLTGTGQTGPVAAQAPKPNSPAGKPRTPGTIPNWRKVLIERRGAAH